MDLEVIDIDENVRLFPTVGEARISLKLAKGATRTLKIPFSKADKLAQLLMKVAETGRQFGADHGFAWPIMNDDLVGETPIVKSVRAMPFSGTGNVGVQFNAEGLGLQTIQLPTDLAQALRAHIQSSLDELAAQSQKPN